MNHSQWEASRLLELRSKTDRELVAFINSRLEFGLRSAGMIARQETGVVWDSPESLRVKAEKAHAEVRTLLPWVGLAAADRSSLESRLQQLRALLEEHSIHAGLRAQTACS